MKVTNWYRNGDLNSYLKFCTQNRRKLISIHLNSSEVVKGVLHDHHFKPLESAGVFVLLTNVVVHPAFFALSDITSLHYLASGELFQTSFGSPSTLT